MIPESEDRPIIAPPTRTGRSSIRAASRPSPDLAYHVGDLAQGDSFGVPINYAVAKALKLVQSNPNLYEFRSTT